MTRIPECCTYCGSTENLTKDHVPPKSLFAKPRPKLITVPACGECHEPTTIDDEYFRVRLGLNDQARGHPDVTANIPSILRSLQRTEAKGMLGQLAADSFPVRLHTPSGLYIGRGSAFHVELERIFRVVSRVVRGLYYHETRQRIPTDHDVLIHSDETLSTMSAKDLKDTMKEIIAPLSLITPKTIGKNVFSYRSAIMEQAFISAWALTYYGRVSFLVIT